MSDMDFQGSYTAFNDGSSLVNISAQVLGVQGLPGEVEARDVTAASETNGRRWDMGLENVQFTLRIKATTGSSEALEILSDNRDDKVARAFERGPNGNGSGALKYSGSAFVTNVSEVGQVGEIITYDVTCRVDGGVTKGTF
jgi:hypothetical protein